MKAICLYYLTVISLLIISNLPLHNFLKMGKNQIGNYKIISALCMVECTKDWVFATFYLTAKKTR